MLYNAAVARVAHTQQNPVLLVGQQQLAVYIHSPQGRAALALPGQDVEIVRGSVSPAQILSHRPSYLNAILIQSRDTTLGHPCIACRSVHPGLRPFPECRRVVGHFGGACANCKWRDHAARCSVRGDEDDDVVVTGQRRLEYHPPGNQRGDGGGEGSSASTAIVLY